MMEYYLILNLDEALGVYFQLVFLSAPGSHYGGFTGRQREISQVVLAVFLVHSAEGLL